MVFPVVAHFLVDESRQVRADAVAATEARQGLSDHSVIKARRQRRALARGHRAAHPRRGVTSITDAQSCAAGACF